MKATRKMMAMFSAAELALGVIAAPSVEITAVQQQYPWTNTVDITYEVRGVTNMEYFVRFTPTTSDDDPILNTEGEASIQVALESNGVFTAQWYPQTNLQYTACKMTPAIFRGGSGGGRDYLIIDLETWDYWYEPMATQEASNQRYNTDEYKTKYMVFRRIPADTYTIGQETAHRTGQYENLKHSVTFPEDYYFALFQLTDAQYDRIANGTTTSTSTLPKQYVTWNQMRGNALILGKPTSGPVHKISSETGLCVDLPTHAMMETAIRAKVTTHWIGGTAEANKQYAGCGGGTDGTRCAVGSYSPNAWGIYDVLGVLHTVLRDGIPTTSYTVDEPKLANGFVPISTGTARTYLDNNWNWAYDYVLQIPGSTYGVSPSGSWPWLGQRLAVYPADYYPSGVKK